MAQSIATGDSILSSASFLPSLLRLYRLIHSSPFSQPENRDALKTNESIRLQAGSIAMGVRTPWKSRASLRMVRQ